MLRTEIRLTESIRGDNHPTPRLRFVRLGQVISRAPGRMSVEQFKPGVAPLFDLLFVESDPAVTKFAADLLPLCHGLAPMSEPIGMMGNRISQYSEMSDILLDGYDLMTLRAWRGGQGNVLFAVSTLSAGFKRWCALCCNGPGRLVSRAAPDLPRIF